jgi:ferredoxin-NADP reductase
MKLQLISVRNREADIKEFAFHPSEPLKWQAGQYMHYVLPHEAADDRGTERWFTNSAAPSEGEVRITTRINHERSSSFKTTLQGLKPGDTIEADGPEGDFTLDDLARDHIFIIGGIGITPVRSILTEAAAKGDQPRATLLYANRSDEVPFRDELEALKSQNSKLIINYIIDPQRIDDELLKSTLASVENPLVYVSGPEPMVKSMLDQLKALGVAEDDLKADDFPGYEAI